MYSKKTILLMLLMALFMPWAARAQETLTVYDGTNSTLTTNNYVPMYGNYFDDYTKSEYVIPAEKLSEMEGAEISALKFYISSVGSYGSGWSGTHQVVFLKEVESASLSAFSGMEGATIVFDDTFEEPVSNATEFEIMFTTNYEYQGGNLLIGIYNTDDGGYRNVTWYGETVNGASGAGSNGSNLNNVSFSQKNFIPKTTFTYTPAGGVSCAKPKSLNAVDITAHTATLTWTAGAEGQSHWDVYLTDSSTDVPNDDTEPTYQVMECTKALSGLTGETSYYAYVRSVCGGTDGNSTWAKKVFTTEVSCPKPTLSYVTYSNTAHSGDVEWTGEAASYEIAYRPTSDFDPSDESLENVTRVQLGNVNTYTLENLNPETKYYIYVQADCGTEDGKSAWSNRVIFTTLATCIAPSSLTDEGVTSSSVYLSWTKGTDDQDAWQFRYKKTSDSDYTYVLVEDHLENTYELTGLEPATSYYVNVRAWCGGDDYSKWSMANQSYDKTITTACAAVTLPYTCDFEGAVETSGHYSSYPVPKCWDRVEYKYGSYSPYSYYPYVYNYTSDAHGGTKSLRMYRTPNSANETIILPEIDESYEMNNLQIRFWAKAGSSNNTLSVGVMENNTFSEVAIVEGISTTYAEFTIPLSSYTGNGRNIAIKCGSSSSYLYYYIDDVLVEVLPTCFIPTGFANTALDVNTASFVWQTGLDETEWNIQYKKASDNEWDNTVHITELPTTENPYVLTGLKRGTEYEARIQAYCAADDQSEWSNTISFTTDCGTWPIDGGHAVYEDFSESTFPPACWNWHRVNNYNGWQYNSSQYNPLDTQGTAYSYWPNGDTYLILPQMHIEGSAVLTFDMLFQGDGEGQGAQVVLSTGGFAIADFSTSLWTAEEFPSSKTTVSLNLSAYNDQDVYVAFKYAGVGTLGRTWYIDNVQVYVADNVFTTEGEWGEGSNWSNGSIPTSTQSAHINAPVTIPSNTTIEVENITVGTGSITISDGGQLKHNNEDVVATVQKNIAGYNRDGSGWHFIAHPMSESVKVSSDTDLTTGTYDLYAFDQAEDLEWRNYMDANNDLTSLKVATGYLYANSTGGTFNVTGTLNPSNTDIVKEVKHIDGMEFAGWNLVGNPFACDAYLAGSQAFYRMNANGDAIATTAATGAIAPMEGVFVYSESAGSVTFTTSASRSTTPQLNLNLNTHRGTLADNAIVRFDQGGSLGKLVLNESISKLSIPQDGQEWAVVPAEGQGELPVNFKAAENGTYSISVEALDIKASYLHLIDNMTGNDINLLQTPSYSFEAKTTDYASRFRLVFATEDAGGTPADQFAYIDANGNIIITCDMGDGEGDACNASLQVVDVMGRVLICRDALNASRNASVSTSGMTPGVYVLRLIIGDSVRTQKIVVK